MVRKDILIQRGEGESISSNPKIIRLEWINRWNGELPRSMPGPGRGIILNPQEE